MNYQHLLFPDRDNFTIVHVESNCAIGFANRRGAKYSVQNDHSEDVAIVSSIDKAIPTLLAYYEKHPTRWHRQSATEYTRLSPLGFLDVEQSQLGWLAYRYRGEGRCPLLRDGNPAIFATCQEAQHAADAHLRDGLPRSEVHADGLSWSSSEERAVATC
jgi:hypothetical protein